MNQILSVEMPKKKSKKNYQGQQHDKLNIKSIIIFFCIVLAIFGIVLIGMAIYSFINKNAEDSSNQAELPRINVTQNIKELEIEISSTSEISNITYNWEEKESQEVNAGGKKSISFNVKIPSGNNIFKIAVTDVNGKRSEYSKEYVGAKEPNIIDFLPKYYTDTGKNMLLVSLSEEEIIKSISYSYDNNTEKTIEINNTKATIEIEELEGKHNLTIKAQYANGDIRDITKELHIPIVNVKTNGTVTNYTKFIVDASDDRMISNVDIYFNGKIYKETINNMNYSKEFELQPGPPTSNKLQITVYNKDGLSITKRVWDKNRQN